MTVWRCTKHRSLKCLCTVYLSLTDESLTQGEKTHNHDPEKQLEQRRELITTLKRKAEEQHLSATQNLITEVLVTSTPELKRTYVGVLGTCGTEEPGGRTH